MIIIKVLISAYILLLAFRIGMQVGANKVAKDIKEIIRNVDEQNGADTDGDQKLGGN